MAYILTRLSSVISAQIHSIANYLITLPETLINNYIIYTSSSTYGVSPLWFPGLPLFHLSLATIWTFSPPSVVFTTIGGTACGLCTLGFLSRSQPLFSMKGLWTKVHPSCSSEDLHFRTSNFWGSFSTVTTMASTWQCGKLPSHVLFTKEKDKSNSANYCPISLLSAISKGMVDVLDSTLKHTYWLINCSMMPVSILPGPLLEISSQPEPNSQLIFLLKTWALQVEWKGDGNAKHSSSITSTLSMFRCKCVPSHLGQTTSTAGIKINEYVAVILIVFLLPALCYFSYRERKRWAWHWMPCDMSGW